MPYTKDDLLNAVSGEVLDSLYEKDPIGFKREFNAILSSKKSLDSSFINKRNDLSERLIWESKKAILDLSKLYAKKIEYNCLEVEFTDAKFNNLLPGNVDRRITDAVREILYSSEGAAEFECWDGDTNIHKNYNGYSVILSFLSYGAYIKAGRLEQKFGGSIFKNNGYLTYQVHGLPKE